MKKISCFLLSLLMMISTLSFAIITPADELEALNCNGEWTQFINQKSLIKSYKLAIPNKTKLNLQIDSKSVIDVELVKNGTTDKLVNTPIIPNTIHYENLILDQGDYTLTVKGINSEYRLCATINGNSVINPTVLTEGVLMKGIDTTSEDGVWYKLDVKADTYKTQLESDGVATAIIYSSDAKTRVGEAIYAQGTSAVADKKTAFISLAAGSYFIKIDAKAKYSITYWTMTQDNCEHNYRWSYVQPTYFKKGYELHTCSICGKKYKDGYVAKRVLNKPNMYFAKPGKKKMTVSFSMVSDATGYEIMYSTSKKFTKKTTYKITKKSNKVTIKNLKSGKKYYVKVRAYKKANGKVAYSSWSKAKKAVIK